MSPHGDAQLSSVGEQKKLHALQHDQATRRSNSIEQRLMGDGPEPVKLRCLLANDFAEWPQIQQDKFRAAWKECQSAEADPMRVEKYAEMLRATGSDIP